MVGPLVMSPERNFDVELRERLLHEPRVGHQFLLGLGRLDGHVRRAGENPSSGNW